MDSDNGAMEILFRESESGESVETSMINFLLLPSIHSLHPRAATGYIIACYLSHLFMAASSL